MIKPTMPNVPGMGAMTDTLDFVKNLWGGMSLPGMNMTGMNMPQLPGMNIPGMVMPTLSVEEINKKIADLKAVESWLTLNMNMLRATIQALEVQAATITTLKTMGDTFAATMKSAGMDKAPEAGVHASWPVPPAPSNGHAATASRQDSAPSSNGMQAANTTGANGAPTANGGDAANGTNANGTNGSAHAATGAAQGAPNSKDEADAAALTAPLVNAAAWWNLLQDQFKQAVSSAMPETTGKGGKAAKGGAKDAAKGTNKDSNKDANKDSAKDGKNEKQAAPATPKAKARPATKRSTASSSGAAAAKRKTTK